MASHVKFPSSIYREAVRNMTDLTPQQQADYLQAIPRDNTPTMVVLDVDNLPLLRELLKYQCNKGARARITQFVVAQDNRDTHAGDWSDLNNGVGSFDSAIYFLQGLKNSMMEVRLAGRWYRFRCPEVETVKANRRVTGIVLPIRFLMVRTVLRVTKVLYREDFKVSHAGKSFKDLLKSLDVRPPRASGATEEDYGRTVGLAVGMAEDYGKQVRFRGDVMEVRIDESNDSWRSGNTWESWKKVFEPERGVVEPELELPDKRRNHYGVEVNDVDTHGTLPFVRMFSLRTRRFVYTDVRNVEPYEYNLNIADRLVLPDKHRAVLTKVFEAGTDTIKDLIPGKTGGICILAWGNPGVGKTLTAEVYAETKERPLYALSVSEIGTTPADIERNLQRVFTRVERWNAVLLFDECDVFLTKRTNDLAQSAVVGMFLRLLEYYTGILFLTTNRLTTIDEAVDSRITFRFHYADLKRKDRRKIWTVLLKEAGIETAQDVLDKLVLLKLDGRKIRNTVRALQLIGTTALNSWEDVEAVMEFVETPKPDDVSGADDS